VATGAIAVAPVEVVSGAPALKVEQLRLPAGVTSAELTSLGCATATSCAAGGQGFSSHSRIVRASVSSETGGVWGALQNVGPTVHEGSSSQIVAVACPAPGSCVAIGDFTSNALGTGMLHSRSFMITQEGSGWSPPQTVPLTGATTDADYGVVNLQCPATNDCVIIGIDDVSAVKQLQYAQTWQGGRWGAPHFFSTSVLGKDVTTLGSRALSCPSTSWCMEVGRYMTASGRTVPLSATMSDGQWGPLTPLTGYRASTNLNALASISCVATGECVATGDSQFGVGGESSVPLIMSVSAGHWAAPRTVVIPGVTSPRLEPTNMPLVSCVRHAKCTGVVSYGVGDSLIVGVATKPRAGRWTVVRVATFGRFKSPFVTALSCLDDVCVAIGSASGTSGPPSVPLVVTSSGSW
jgi:hypothetical protein